MNEEQESQRDSRRIEVEAEKEEEKSKQQQFLYMGRCKSCQDPLILYFNMDESEDAVLKCGCKSRLIMIGRWQRRNKE